MKCPECGSEDLTGPDEEELFDCYGCGLWFKSEEAQ